VRETTVVQLLKVFTLVRSHNLVSFLFQDDLEELKNIWLIVYNEEAPGGSLH
jgi:hypothetical protein